MASSHTGAAIRQESSGSSQIASGKLADKTILPPAEQITTSVLRKSAAEPRSANAVALEDPDVWWAVPVGRGGALATSTLYIYISHFLHTSPESTKTQTPTDGGTDGVHV